MKVVAVDTLVLDGLRQRLEEVFAAPVVLSNSSDAIQQLNRASADGNRTQYPFITGALTEFGPNWTGYRPHQMLRRGTTVSLTDDENRVFTATLIPASFTFELSYYDADFTRCLNYAKTWAFSSTGGWLKFTVQYGRLALDIHITLAESVTLPVREADPTNATEYVVTSTLTVLGYSSRETLRELPVVKRLDVEAVLRDNSVEGAQIFMFSQR